MFCNICGREIETIVRHNEYPFIDGRTYDLICFICFSVPKTWHYDEENDDWIRVYDTLNTIEEMRVHGWEKHESEPSIKAIKKLMQNKLLIVEPVGGTHSFDTLFINNKKDLATAH